MVTTKEKMSFIIVCGFIGIFLFILCGQARQAQAQVSINERIERQHKRIDQGVRAGHLTPDEKRILTDNVNYVRDQEAHFKASGAIPAAEREHLQRLLDENSHMIDKKAPVKTLRAGTGSPGIGAPGKEAPAKAATTVAPAKPAQPEGKVTTPTRQPPAKGMVWVNTATKVYHVEGDPYYGKTKNGEWMTEEDAIKKGFHKSK